VVLSCGEAVYSTPAVGRPARRRCCHRVCSETGASLAAACRFEMGQAESTLTQYDVEELQEACNYRFTHQEILTLYKRFRQLDRGRKGFITSEELLNIPELSVNPLANSVVHAFDCVNFMEFVRLLSAFSPRATRQEKLEFMFRIYDVDGDGIVTASDMQLILRQMAGSTLSSDQVKHLINQVEKECGGWEGGLRLPNFIQALEGREITMVADMAEGI